MRKLALIALLLLAGCVSMTDVVSVGPDTYMVGTTARGGLGSNTEVTFGAIKRAKEYCATQHKDMALVSSSSNGTQGWTPQNSEIVFRCT